MNKVCILLFIVVVVAGCSGKTADCGFFVLEKDLANCERVKSNPNSGSRF